MICAQLRSLQLSATETIFARLSANERKWAQMSATERIHYIFCAQLRLVRLSANFKNISGLNLRSECEMGRAQMFAIICAHSTWVEMSVTERPFATDRCLSAIYVYDYERKFDAHFSLAMHYYVNLLSQIIKKFSSLFFVCKRFTICTRVGN